MNINRGVFWEESLISGQKTTAQPYEPFEFPVESRVGRMIDFPIANNLITFHVMAAASHKATYTLSTPSVYQVQRVLTEKYGFSSEAAAEATQKFLSNFRECPENPDFHLDDWRRSLWGSSLGKKHVDITGEVYLQWLDLRFKYLAPSAEVISLLEALRKSYRLAVITNGPSNAQWEKIIRLRLSQYFQLVLVSGDVKWEKPDENIFLQACLRLGVLPEECVMVGDKLETDILGGIRARLGATVWMRGPEDTGAGAGLPRTPVATQANDPPFEGPTVKIVPDCVAHDLRELNCFLLSEFRRATRPHPPEERRAENAGEEDGSTR